MVKKAVKLVVNGTVQGVFFRQYVKDYADKMAIRGFVRNLEDGTVEIVGEGENEDIDGFVLEIKRGPKHAQIRNVSVEEKKWSGDYKEFKVLKF